MSKMQGLVPPPPGEVANFVDPPTEQANNIALHVVMLFFVTVCVAIRVYTRAFITRKVELDDCEWLRSRWWLWTNVKMQTCVFLHS